MPIGTPFHEKTKTLCTSYRWKEWAGHYAVCSYDTCHEPEYFTLRHSAGLIDVSPLFKYDVRGPDAARFLSWLTVRDIESLKSNQVTYCCWCDDFGKIIDDGTITRLDEDYFRVTAAEPSYSWMRRRERGFRIEIVDCTEEIGVLSLQGPFSRDILKACSDANLDQLRFFRATNAKLEGLSVLITRTGYTGDLGYEIWTDRTQAHALWDALFMAGRKYGLQACGLDAMDMTRVEAGFILNGVDYFSAHHCFLESRKSSPFELGLGWMINLEREPFIGQAALKREKREGSPWAFVGLEVNWDETEATFAKHGLPPQISSRAWRTAVPLFDLDGNQIGQATSGTWSPTLKKNIALASIRRAFAHEGNELKFELTVEYHREKVKAQVVALPFFNPERKKA